MKYEGSITSIGKLALQFLNTNHTLIIFNEAVPLALKDMVVTHDGKKPALEILPGDRLTLGKQTYVIADVGVTANQSLRENGHCTLIFRKDGHATLPGQIALQGDLHPHFILGETIRFE